MGTIGKLTIFGSIFFCMSLIVFPQDEKTQLDSMDNTPVVFLKAEMSPTKLYFKRGYMRNCHEGEYKDRRFSAEGVRGRTLLIGAFKITGDQLIDKVGLSEDLYSVDVIVPRGMEQMQFGLIRKTIMSGLGVTANWETIETQVGVLKLLDEKALKPLTSRKNMSSWSTDDSKLKSTNATLKEFARFLAGTSVAMPVIDETEIEGKYDFDIEWDAGSLESLNMALNKIGLQITTEVLPMKLVVVRSAI